MRFFNLFNGNSREYHLEDVVVLNKQSPRTFLIPPIEEIEKIEMGTLVKLIFVMENALKNGCRAERMWVKVKNIKDGVYTGVVDNDPYYLKTIKSGDIITFKAENIACIYGGKPNFDEKLFAIITKKALENRQINWVVRTHDIDNEQDSGWQLFYGDESPKYLDEPDNASIVSLENILSFEPLLEKVFSSSGLAYEYSQTDNKFVKVKE